MSKGLRLIVGISVLLVALVLAAPASAQEPPYDIAEPYCVGPDLYIEVTLLPGTPNDYRVNGTGPNLPSGSYRAPGTYLYVIEGPGTWSGLIFEWEISSSWFPSTFYLISPDSITCEEAEPGPEPVPGCDVLLPIPATAVGGTFMADAPVYWEPGELTSPLVTISAGNSARVLGVDESGEYYKIIWGCDLVWVPAGTMGPNYDAVWNGRPLPTGVVN
ncbi:MAG: hypothetical protein M5U29_09335 [Anaerolineae bacterium]|nr:hypothetical protein [Anaerolineae bacterium]